MSATQVRRRNIRSLIQLTVLQRTLRYQINLSRLWHRAHRLLAATSRSRPPSQNSPISEPQTMCRPGFRFLWLYHFPDFSRSVYLGSGRPIRKIKVPQNYNKFRRQFSVQKINQYCTQRNDWQQIDQPWQLRRRTNFSLRSLLLQHQVHYPNARRMSLSLIRRAQFPIVPACTAASRNGNIIRSIHYSCRLLSLYIALLRIE